MWYTVTSVLVLLGSMLLCASLIWNGPLRRGREGKRWWEGYEGSPWGILMSHLVPSLSHLHHCGWWKVSEKVGKPFIWKILLLRKFNPQYLLNHHFVALEQTYTEHIFMLLYTVCENSSTRAWLHTWKVYYITQNLYFLMQATIYCHVLNTREGNQDDLTA